MKKLRASRAKRKVAETEEAGKRRRQGGGGQGGGGREEEEAGRRRRRGEQGRLAGRCARRPMKRSCERVGRKG
eukprot:754191-Hanusia_phi.AAC.4